MQNTMDDDAIFFNVEEHAVVSRSQPIIGVEIGQPFDVAAQSVLEAGDFCDDLPRKSLRKAAEIIQREFGVDNLPGSNRSNQPLLCLKLNHLAAAPRRSLLLARQLLALR
ncbi:hypothetical protein BH20VER1_BH20VER1_27680 [soil metagenome]